MSKRTLRRPLCYLKQNQIQRPTKESGVVPRLLGSTSLWQFHTRQTLLYLSKLPSQRLSHRDWCFSCQRLNRDPLIPSLTPLTDSFLPILIQRQSKQPMSVIGTIFGLRLHNICFVLKRKI